MKASLSIALIMNINEYQLEVWIGLAKVSSKTDILGKAKGTYVNVVSLGKNRTGFLNRIKDQLERMKIHLIRLENAETFYSRKRKFRLTAELNMLARDTIKRNNQICVSTFLTFD